MLGRIPHVRPARDTSPPQLNNSNNRKPPVLRHRGFLFGRRHLSRTINRGKGIRYGHLVNFEKMVVPLMAPGYMTNESFNIGSGFLARINDCLYLVTVAHLADYVLSPRADWTLWPDNIWLVNPEIPFAQGSTPTTVKNYPLFAMSYEGKKVPRFKYVLRTEPERQGEIQDVILLPILANDPIVKLYDPFDLPSDSGAFSVGAKVTMLGRRRPFPALSAVEHTLTQDSVLVRYMEPEGANGDSGGPVVTSTNQLLGINIGTHINIPGAMLMSTEAIAYVATSIRGNGGDWPRTLPSAPEHERRE